MAPLGLTDALDVGGGTLDAVYDAAKGETFVTGACGFSAPSSCVAVINDTSDSVAATVPWGPPSGLPIPGAVLDTGRGQLFLSGPGGNVSILSAASDSVVATVPVGGCPSGEAYDPGTGDVYVANSCANSLKVISDASETVIATVALGQPSCGVAYDAGTNQVFVTERQNVTVLSASDDTVVARVPVAFASNSTMAYDPAKGEILLSNSSGIVVISDATDRVTAIVPTGFFSYGMTYAPGRGQLLVSTYYCGASLGPGGPNSCLLVINDTTDAVVQRIGLGYAFPNGAAYDPRTGQAFVANGGPWVDIFATGYNVTFTEKGLASGYCWNLTFRSWNDPNVCGSSVNFTELNGSYRFAVGTVDGYGVSPSLGSVRVDGAAVTVLITFSPTTFNVTFRVTHVPSGLPWSVTLGGTQGGTTNSTVTFRMPNGTYPFNVEPPTGYVVEPSSGNVTVNGTPVLVPIVGTAVYTVYANETNLAVGTNWSLTLAGSTRHSTGTSIQFVEPNGTYAFVVPFLGGYTVTPRDGSVVVNGTGAELSLTFSLVTYPVTFGESGLPVGTTWSVLLSGISRSTNGSRVAFEEPNGTYSFAAGTAADYDMTPPSGWITVDNGSVQVPLIAVFVSTITFDELGLPLGTSWSLTLNGEVQSSTGPDISFTSPNGSFSFQVSASNGYVAAPSSGLVAIEGLPVSYMIEFTAPPPPPPAPGLGEGWLGLPGYAGAYLVLWNTLTTATLLALIVLFGRRAKPPAAPR